MNKKLKLSKETLKTLSTKLLAQVVGGTDVDDSGWCPAGTTSDTGYVGDTEGCNGG